MTATLTIDDELMKVARDMASAAHTSVDEAVSALIRRGIGVNALGGGYRNGIPLLPVTENSRPVTSELVRQLTDE